MLVVYENEEYVLDMDELTVKQAQQIQNYSGHTLASLDEALEQADPKALIAMFWLMRNMNGHADHIERIDFKIVKFAHALQEAADRQKEEDEAEAAEQAAAEKAGRAKRIAPKAQTQD